MQNNIWETLEKFIEPQNNQNYTKKLYHDDFDEKYLEDLLQRSLEPVDLEIQKSFAKIPRFYTPKVVWISANWLMTRKVC
jgi:hypothetical protein